MFTSIKNFYQKKNLHILSNTTPWREITALISSTSENQSVVFNVGASASLRYYLRNQSNVYSYDFNKIIESKLFNKTNLWVVVSNPSFNKEFEIITKLLSSNNNFELISSNKFKRDANFQLKKSYFNKDFSEFRARVFCYKIIN